MNRASAAAGGLCDGIAVHMISAVPEGLQLVEAGLLARERRGRFAYFSLVPGSLDRLQALIAVPARRRDAA